MGNVQIAGLAELKKALGAFSSEMALKASRQAVAAVGYSMAAEARKNLKASGSVRTGTLLRNIAVAREKTPPSRVTFNVGVRHGKKSKNARKVVSYRGTRKSVKYENDPYYFFMVEFGTKNMAARPYLRPAFDAVTPKARDILARRLSKTIEKFKQGKR